MWQNAAKVRTSPAAFQHAEPGEQRIIILLKFEFDYAVSCDAYSHFLICQTCHASGLLPFTHFRIFPLQNSIDLVWFCNYEKVREKSHSIQKMDETPKIA